MKGAAGLLLFGFCALGGVECTRLTLWVSRVGMDVIIPFLTCAIYVSFHHLSWLLLRCRALVLLMGRDMRVLISGLLRASHFVGAVQSKSLCIKGARVMYRTLHLGGFCLLLGWNAFMFEVWWRC